MAYMELTSTMVLIRSQHSTNVAGKSTDQRKPFGCAITRLLFPSENINFATTPREQSRGQKGMEWSKQQGQFRVNLKSDT